MRKDDLSPMCLDKSLGFYFPLFVSPRSSTQRQQDFYFKSPSNIIFYVSGNVVFKYLI
ncbi:hypothetical protein AGMMS50233_11080 [Endomicrobiia bacterium]|nr:hypothetical protein AGMMS50233_11060 [Endomicrobiia bacterium]GHT57756.1 hypothetical protein AGMMS50233_11080 [Endomicrobiia bacterium]